MGDRREYNLARGRRPIQRSCIGCGETITTCINGPQCCDKCRHKKRHHVGQKPEYVMTAAEADAYLAACVELESIPDALHRGRHYFPNVERCRCVKCGCTRAAAENTVCAERR